ncbi:MAG: nitroreductase family protein [Verrucomicrobiia bacterium]
MQVNLAAGSSARKAAPLKTVPDPWQVSPEDVPADGTSEEQLWFALSKAILAPSTHNTQPWHFAIRRNEVDLMADYSRDLPVVDPQGRELILSCGAALFFLQLALRYLGVEPRLDLFPSDDRPDWLARVHLGPKGETPTDSILLFQAIPKRSTNRKAFKPDPVPEALLSELEGAAQAEGAWFRILRDETERAAAADLIAEGDRRQWADRQFRKELAAWVRPPSSRRRDGLPVSTQDLGPLMSRAGPFAIRTFDLGKGHAAKDQDIALHSPVLAVLGTENDTPAAWLAAGQALARVLLEAQSEGLSASFLNQAIEVAELRPALGEITALPGFPQLLLRMGYGQPAPHTRRRGVREVTFFDASC